MLLFLLATDISWAQSIFYPLVQAGLEFLVCLIKRWAHDISFLKLLNRSSWHLKCSKKGLQKLFYLSIDGNYFQAGWKIPCWSSYKIEKNYGLDSDYFKDIENIVSLGGFVCLHFFAASHVWFFSILTCHTWLKVTGLEDNGNR